VTEKLNQKVAVNFCPSHELVQDIDAKMVALAASAGDRVANEIIGISAGYLGQALSTLIDILNPECIVIGSIYARNEMLFKPLIEKVLQEETIPASLEVCRIIPAGLGESIGDFAALCVAIYEDKF
jgi:glucokinase